MREINNSPECEERIIDLDFIKTNTKFYILDKRQREAIAICWIDSKEKQRGFNFYKHNKGWDFNPTVTGKEVITLLLGEDRYDITSDFETAIKNCDQTICQPKTK